MFSVCTHSTLIPVLLGLVNFVCLDTNLLSKELVKSHLRVIGTLNLVFKQYFAKKFPCEI